MTWTWGSYWILRLVSAQNSFPGRFVGEMDETYEEDAARRVSWLS